MKFLIVSSFFLSLNLLAAASNVADQGYEPNSGMASPGTFSSPEGLDDVVPPTTSEGVIRAFPQTGGSEDQSMKAPAKGKSAEAMYGDKDPKVQAQEEATGVSREDLNTSPNPAPEGSPADNTTLRNGSQQRQEVEPLDPGVPYLNPEDETEGNPEVPKR